MSQRVRITDVSPRDGLQNEPGVVPSAEKTALVRALCAANVDEVEVTSFVSPRWVPQLGDAAEVLGALKEDCASAETADEQSPSPRGRGVRGEGAAPIGAPGVRLDRTEHGTDRARELRRDMTPPERALWARLRRDQIHGKRFRRQHAMGPYIVDFYCPEAALVIELDGRSHEQADAVSHDEARNKWLTEQGLYVERFANEDIGDRLDAVVQRIGDLVTERCSSNPLPQPLSLGVWGAGRPVFSALVPNEKGFERLLEIHSPAFPLKVAVFTAASETFSKKNTNATIDETVERFRAFVPRALEMGMAVRVYVSCVIACPFEGAIAPAQVRGVCDRLRVLGGDDAWGSGRLELDLGDTIGAGDRASTRAMLSEFSDGERERMTLHLHDTFGKAAECVREGLAMGVRSFDGSVAGLGGCPYAGTKEKPAPGNVSTETVIETANDEGFHTGVDIGFLREAAALAREIVGRSRAGAAS